MNGKPKEKNIGRELSLVRQLIAFFLCAASLAICILFPVGEGFELLFLLPLSCGLCVLLFWRTFGYWKQNLAFTVLFACIWVRYAVTPAMISLTGTYLDFLNPSTESLRFACILSAFELFLIVMTVEFVWSRHQRRQQDLAVRAEKLAREKAEPEQDAPAQFRLTWTGALFLIVLAAAIIVRGHATSVFSHFSTWFRTSEDKTELYTYDMIAIQVLIAGVVLVLISGLAKLYARSKGLIRIPLFLLAAAVALGNTYFYMFDQRTALFQLIFATMVMFGAFFPKQRKAIFAVMGVGGAVAVFVLFLSGTLKFDVGDEITGSFFERLSQSLELYTTGPSMTAAAIDSIPAVREGMSADVLWSDLIHTLQITSSVPFLRFLRTGMAGVPTTNTLFKAAIGNRNFIVPNYVQASYYVSELFGWLLEAGFVFVTVKLICVCDGQKRKQRDALYFYAFSYFEILLGQAFLNNNFRLLWHAASNLPLWLIVFALINSIGSRVRIGFGIKPSLGKEQA